MRVQEHGRRRAGAAPRAARAPCACRPGRARSSARRAAGGAATRPGPGRFRGAAASPSTSRRRSGRLHPSEPTSSRSSARSAAPPSDPARRWWSSSTSSRARPAGEPEELGEIAERGPGGTGARRGAADLGRAGRGRDQPAGDLHERRLAGSVRPEEPDQLALADLEVDAAECLDRPVSLGQPAGGERESHWGLG